MSNSHFLFTTDTSKLFLQKMSFPGLSNSSLGVPCPWLAAYLPLSYFSYVWVLLLYCVQAQLSTLPLSHQEEQQL